MTDTLPETAVRNGVNLTHGVPVSIEIDTD